MNEVEKLIEGCRREWRADYMIENSLFSQKPQDGKRYARRWDKNLDMYVWVEF